MAQLIGSIPAGIDPDYEDCPDRPLSPIKRARQALENLPSNCVSLPARSRLKRVNEWLTAQDMKPVSLTTMERAIKPPPPPPPPPAMPKEKTLLERCKEFVDGKFAAPATEVRLLRSKPKQEIVRRALAKPYPRGVPVEVSNKRLIQRVVKQLKDDGQWSKEDLARPISDETILRTAGRK
jgi:hypothetical protein